MLSQNEISSLCPNCPAMEFRAQTVGAITEENQQLLTLYYDVIFSTIAAGNLNPDNTLQDASESFIEQIQKLY